MAWVKALCVVVITWLLLDLGMVLLKPFIGLFSMTEILVGLAASISLMAVVLTVKLKTPARGEAWLWGLMVWAFLFMATVFENQVIEPILACNRFEQVVQEAPLSKHEELGLLVAGQCKGTTVARLLGKQIDGAPMVPYQMILVFLIAALLQLVGMANLRMWRNSAPFHPWRGTFGLFLLQSVYGIAVACLFVVGVMMTLIVPLVGLVPFPFGKVESFLGSYGSLGLIAAVVCVVLWNYVWLFRKLLAHFRAREVA